MAESNNTPNNNVFSENDTLDINELASLNNDISADFIEQLQNQVSQSANQLSGVSAQEESDANLFEEVSEQNQEPANPVPQEIEDDFAKKYKAKMNNQNLLPKEAEEKPETPAEEKVIEEQPAAAEAATEKPKQTEVASEEEPAAASAEVPKETANSTSDETNKPIENLTGGNITEKPISKEQTEYNHSLDYLDNNVKYSKYVIYIDPQNKDFIDSLTVKERKNLINRIIREQDDIAVTKRRLSTIQTVIKHVIIAIITIALSIPVIYMVINASLEATINNQRRSQSLFQTLYKEHGKIKTNVQK